MLYYHYILWVVAKFLYRSDHGGAVQCGSVIVLCAFVVAAPSEAAGVSRRWRVSCWDASGWLLSRCWSVVVLCLLSFKFAECCDRFWLLCVNFLIASELERYARRLAARPGGSEPPRPARAP